MEVKPGYKQTEVGVIPEDWDVRHLSEITDPKRPIGYGIVQTGRRIANGVKCVRVVDIENGKVNGDDLIRTSHEISAAYKRTLLAEGDLVIALRGKIGALAIIDKDLVGANLTRGVALLAPLDGYDSNYLCHYLSSPSGKQVFEKNLNGSALQEIPIATLRKIPAIVPRPPEQRAIAEALSDVDALLGALDRLIVKKHDLKQAVMQQLLTGQSRLPGFQGEWVVKRLGDVGEITSAGVDKKIRPDEAHVRLVNYLDVYRRDFIYSKDLNHWVTAPLHQAKRCAVQKGDVFFTPTSETRDDIGVSAVAMEDIPDAAYSYHVARLRLWEPWDLRFRTYIFKTRAFLDQAETLCDGNGTRYVISQGKFRSMTVLVPPVPEQTAIAEVLSDIDAELAALEQRRDKTRALKQGMMQELLTGRTRLVKSGNSGVDGK